MPLPSAHHCDCRRKHDSTSTTESTQHTAASMQHTTESTQHTAVGAHSVGLQAADREKTLRVSRDILNFTSEAVMMHITCLNLSRKAAKELLDRTRDAGIKNLLVLRGGVLPHPQIFDALIHAAAAIALSSRSCSCCLLLCRE